MQQGRQYFLDYISAGMMAESRSGSSRNGSSGSELQAWDHATKQFYGYDDLSDLQVVWLDWVRKGSQPLPDQRVASNVALASHVTEPDQVATPNSTPNVSGIADAKTVLIEAAADLESTATARIASVDYPKSGSWYVRQAQSGASRVAANREPFSDSADVLPKTERLTIDEIDVSNRGPKLQPAPVVPDEASLNSYQSSPRTIWR
jgi:hypothetical protein